MKNIEEMSENYDLVYEEAGKLVNKYNPCQFESGKCIVAREKNIKICCKPCYYLTDKGCDVKALGCKVAFCPDIWKLFSEPLTQKFSKLRRKAVNKVAISVLVCFESKEDFFERYRAESKLIEKGETDD